MGPGPEARILARILARVLPIRAGFHFRRIAVQATLPVIRTAA